MALPPREFYSVIEVASRWGCCPADIAGWALAGRFSIMTPITPVACGMEPVAGVVKINASDIMVLFRRQGRSAKSCTIRRILPQNSAVWMYVTNPGSGIKVYPADLLLSAEDVLAFEEECDLLRRPGSRGGGAGGSGTRYDWDGMYVEIIRTVHERGVPHKQADLVAIITEWFHQHSEAGDIPDESTIRKRLAPVWRRLRETA